MNHLAYQELAREVLWLLLERDDLRSAVHDRIVAYPIYHLPPALDLEIPDEDRFEPLLNPLTRDAHAARLEAAVLHIATHQERDGWVVSSPRIRIRPALARGHDRLVVRPDYLAADTDSVLHEPDAPRPSRPAMPEAVRDEPLVRVELEGRDQSLTLQRGDGLIPVSRGRTRPRITLFGPDPATDDGRDLATLYANAPMRVASAEGAVRTVPAFTPVPITHDLEFQIAARPWKFWQRAVRGTVQILGVARGRRPGMRITLRDGTTHVWDRNRQAALRIGNDPDDHLVLAETTPDTFELLAGGADRIDVRCTAARSSQLTWFDGRPLALAPDNTVSVLGAHLRGLGLTTPLAVAVDGDPRAQAPSVTVLRATHGDSLGDALPVAPSLGDGASGPGLDELFGFEAPIASVYCDGQLLEAHAGEPERIVSLELGRNDLVGPLLKLATDGLGGVKLMPLVDAVKIVADGRTAPTATWVQVNDLAQVSLPRGSLRIEAMGRPRITFGRPVQVRSLSADPNAHWRVGGWRLAVTDEALVVSGRGRDPLRIDQNEVPRELAGEHTVPARAEHRVELGGVLYRIVRHHPARTALDGSAAAASSATAGRDRRTGAAWESIP